MDVVKNTTTTHTERHENTYTETEVQSVTGHRRFVGGEKEMYNDPQVYNDPATGTPTEDPFHESEGCRVQGMPFP